MAKKEVSGRAERIIRLLPKIMGSIARWHEHRFPGGITENGKMAGTFGDASIPSKGKLKLTFNQYQALTVIQELGTCSVNELAHKLRLAQSTTSQLVDRLVRGGFVTREIFPDDRRRMVVGLSKSGKEMMERRRQTLLRSYERILSMLDDADQEMLEDAFNKFFQVSQKLEQNAEQRGV